MLTAQDVTMIEKLSYLKEEVKQMEELLKPRIQQAYMEHGDGMVTIGARVVKLSYTGRTSVSWKGLAEAEITADRIAEIKDRHSSQSISYAAKIVGRAENVPEEMKMSIAA